MSGPTPDFDVQSYIGTDIAQLREGGERPPKSAKLVVDVDLGSHPGGGDYRTYLISTNRERSSWILWLRGENPDHDKPPFLYCRIATGRPYRGYSAKNAAERLLTKSWQDERDKWGLVPPSTHVWKAGLLTKKDMRRVTSIVFGDDAVKACRASTTA